MQCENMIASIKLFEHSCELAAKKDDDKISKEEAKTLKVIRKAGANYIKILKSVIEK